MGGQSATALTRREFCTTLGAGLAVPLLGAPVRAKDGVAPAWHNKPLDEHVRLRDAAKRQGYRIRSLSIYGPASSPLFATVMTKGPALQRDWPMLPRSEFQSVVDEMMRGGYGPVIISATGPVSNPVFGAVFEPQNPMPIFKTELTLGLRNDRNESTIHGMNRKAKREGYMLRWAASYGTASDPRFAGIWAANPERVIWNADGIVEPRADFVERSSAQAETWCRPSFVTLNEDEQYLSVFVDNQIEGWVSRHGMTADAYQAEAVALTSKGFQPVCLQAAGGSAASARFAAIFAKSEKTVERRWTATGPESNAEIDRIAKDIMTTSAIGHMSLAIVKGTRLVYARGYTWAEPDWPVAQPTTCFRIASVSKTVTALAIYQLIQEKKLALTDRVQDVLELRTPAGAVPRDARFGQITIQHLLEHTGGLLPYAASQTMRVIDAHEVARPEREWTLPVTPAMIDAYIASLDLVFAPGEAQRYNNCAYYLLGRILAKKRGASAMEAIDRHLLAPLGIKRIRSQRDLASAQPSDEARYRINLNSDGMPDIRIARSYATEDRPLVSVGYGAEALEGQEGTGGMSAAATDLARIAAILIGQADCTALTSATIKDLLARALATEQSYRASGHGFDSMRDLGGGKFSAAKGGSLATSQNAFRIEGEWGFVWCCGGRLTDSRRWRELLFHAMTAMKWDGRDLFPVFGMPSL